MTERRDEPKTVRQHADEAMEHLGSASMHLSALLVDIDPDSDVGYRLTEALHHVEAAGQQHAQAILAALDTAERPCGCTFPLIPECECEITCVHCWPSFHHDPTDDDPDPETDA